MKKYLHTVPWWQPHTRRRRPTTWWSVALCACVTSSVGLTVTTPQVVTAATLDLRLTAQNFNLSQSSSLRIVVQIENDAARNSVTQDPTSLFRILAGTPVTSRAEIGDIDSGTTSLTPLSQVDILATRAVASAGGKFTLFVPTTTGLRNDALSLKNSGIYPIGVQVVQREQVTAQLTTFINVFDTAALYPPMPVSIALSVTSPPTLQPDGTTIISYGVRTQLTRLADVLEVKAAPFSVLVQPELLDGLARSIDPQDIELLARLRSSFPNHDLLTTTFVSFDPSSAQRASMTSQFAEQLRRGEDTIDANNGDGLPRRNVWLSRDTVDLDGTALLHDLGIQTLVLLPQAVTSLGPLKSYAHPYKVGDGGSGTTNVVTLIVSDPGYAQELSGTHENPVLSAYRIAAEILAERSEVLAAKGDPTTRITVLATNTGDPQDPALLGPLAVALDHAPQLVLQALSSSQPAGNDATSLSPPHAARADVATTRDTLEAIRNEIRSTSTMFAPDAPQPAQWTKLIAVASSDTLTNDEFAAYIHHIRAQMKAIRTSIKVPESLAFTLSGKESRLRLQLHNIAPQPLSIIVDLVSAKLQFPEGSQAVTILGESTTDLVVPVVARANGIFPIEVVLHTPDGVTQVGRRIQLSARVSALAGLGQLATGTAILILIAWWVAHVRRNRRDNSKQKHPAVR